MTIEERLLALAQDVAELKEAFATLDSGCATADTLVSLLQQQVSDLTTALQETNTVAVSNTIRITALEETALTGNLVGGTDSDQCKENIIK